MQKISCPASANIVDELEEPEIERQLFRRDVAVRLQPGSQKRSETLHGVDVDLAEPVTILVPGVFAANMVDSLVAVAETRKPGVNPVLISIRITSWPPRSTMPTNPPYRLGPWRLL
jgi:hypothetical protein